MHKIEAIHIVYGKEPATSHKSWDDVRTYLHAALQGKRRGWSANVTVSVTWDDNTRWIAFGVIDWQMPSMARIVREDIFRTMDGNDLDRRLAAIELLESYEL